jgi:chemotaxis protein CheD
VPDIHLNPGDYHFGGPDTRIHTVLGSCVSITMWHAGLRVGGMCHYLLPGPGPQDEPHNGRYADGAIRRFLHDVRRVRTSPPQYEVKMFGGGQQFPHLIVPEALDVANHNIAAGVSLLEDLGFAISVRELGGTGARRLIFDVGTGTVWLRAVAATA